MAKVGNLYACYNFLTDIELTNNSQNHITHRLTGDYAVWPDLRASRGRFEGHFGGLKKWKSGWKRDFDSLGTVPSERFHGYFTGVMQATVSQALAHARLFFLRS